MKHQSTLRIAAIALGLVAGTANVFAGKQGRVDLSAMVTPTYTVDGDAFVIHNGARYSNRPLYCNHIYAIALAGDKPLAMVGKTANIFGNLMFALVRDGKGTWLQNASDITSTYRPGRMEWVVKDAAWGTTAVHLEIVPSATGPGMCAHLSVQDAQPGDSLVWASGAASMQKGSILWVYDMTSLKSGLDKRGFHPEDCAGDQVSVQANAWKIQAGRPARAAGDRPMQRADESDDRRRVSLAGSGPHCSKAKRNPSRSPAGRLRSLRIRTFTGTCLVPTPAVENLPRKNSPPAWIAKNQSRTGSSLTRLIPG